MKKARNQISIEGGVYLVLDPAIEKKELLEKLEQSLDGGVDVIQIWNHWPVSYSANDIRQIVKEILSISDKYSVPVLINEEWQLLKTTDLDGVHFDEIPEDYESIQSEIDRDFISGITCSNDLEVIKWADQNGFNYISFCSMFPSSSVDSCEIVRPETVEKARDITDLPLFLSGGITAENLPDLEGLDFQGVAVISGILNSDSPKRSTIDYKKVLRTRNMRRGVSGGRSEEDLRSE